MDAPTWLSHKPVFTVADYDNKDGIYADGTDARALSIGYAQYDADEFSAKVFRQKENGHWSRQSEELPLHRVLDLAILLVAAMKRTPDSQGSLSKLNEKVTSPAGFDELQKYLNDAANADHLQPRLAELKHLLSL